MRPTAADPAAHVWAQLRPVDREWLRQLAQAAGSSRLSLVGGAVRDALLGRTPSDLDIVVEDAAGGAVERLAQASGGPFVFHPAFQNATLTVPNGGSADLVRARRETYPQPGRNPVPSPGTLEDDLRRRDFAVNALALVLHPDAAPEVLDVVGGLSDLERAELRPLHSQSFHEDASRLVRGARLAARLGLHATPELLAQVPDALALANATPRLWAEIKLLLAEPRPGAAAAQLYDWGAGELLPGLPLLRQLDALQDAGKAVTPAVYSAALLSAVPDPDAWAERLSLGRGPLGLLERALSDTFYPAQTPERLLRSLLRPESYPPLTGRDVLALGASPGPGVGQALAHLANLRRTGQVRSADEEREALRAYLQETQNRG